MGKVFSIFQRQTSRLFVEERAERVISRPKPTMHPYYPTEEKIMQRIRAEHPELNQKIAEKLPQLDDHLKKVRVVSENIFIEPPRVDADEGRQKHLEGESTAKNLLPQAHTTVDEAEEPDFNEPPQEKIPKGHILFSEAMKLLQLQRESPEKALETAKNFGIDAERAEHVFKFYAPFTDIQTLKTLLKEDFERLTAEKLLTGEQEMERTIELRRKHRQISELEARQMQRQMIEAERKAKELLEDEDAKIEGKEEKTTKRLGTS